MKHPIRLLVAAFLLTLGLEAQAEKPKPFVFTPTHGAGPFPVALWLHGYKGYSVEGYDDTAVMQKQADTLGAVIIGFPATTDLGDDTQQWSQEPMADHAYIQWWLHQIGKTNKLDLSRVALFGFSQGAMVAGDLASNYPDSYRGAILMSPGGIGSSKAAEARKPEHEQQVYFCFCGADEHPANVGLTKAYARHLGTVLGAKVTLKLYTGMSKHTRPPDFTEKFPEWISAILKPEAKPKP